MRLSPRAILSFWEKLKAGSVDVFKPGVLSTLTRLPEWSMFGQSEASGDGVPTVAFLDALRALALQDRRNMESIAAELVVTLPVHDPAVLATTDVIKTMLESARQSILIVGYEVSEPSVRRILFRRGLDQIDVVIVGDRQRGSAREILKDWPAAARPLRALDNIEPVSMSQSLLHAKVIVIDEKTVLIGSANFTAGGLRNNFEIGVRITGRLASDISRLVTRLEKDGWLIPARP